MPWMIEHMKDDDRWCVHKKNEDGVAGEKVKCHASEKEAKEHMAALYANAPEMMAVKALGDWEIEIRAVPFGKDRDSQTFDSQTDYMLADFPTPVITYHHGINPGKRGIQENPVIIGKTVNVEQRQDGIYLRVLLNKTIEFASRVWEAAKKGLAVASSDSIAHLARLEVNGKRIMYEKDRPGRIAVWPLAGVSLWDATGENFRPASPNAIALPAMKAMYRDAGLPFPDVDTGGVSEAEKAKRARVINRSKQLLKSTRQWV